MLLHNPVARPMVPNCTFLYCCSRQRVFKRTDFLLLSLSWRRLNWKTSIVGNIMVTSNTSCAKSMACPLQPHRPKTPPYFTILINGIILANNRTSTSVRAPSSGGIGPGSRLFQYALGGASQLLHFRCALHR